VELKSTGKGVKFAVFVASHSSFQHDEQIEQPLAFGGTQSVRTICFRTILKLDRFI